MKTTLVALLLAHAGCGDNASATVDAPNHPIDAAIDTPTDAPDHRDQTLELAGVANGLLWDDTAKILYFTDKDAVKLMSYTDAGGVQILTALPASASGVDPGEITISANHLVTPNLGNGSSPANVVFFVDPLGIDTKSTTGLDTSRHRIGVGAAGGVLFDGYFTGTASTAVGHVATLAIAGNGSATETDLVFGAPPTFNELVGLVATTDALFVSDGTQNKVFKITLPGHVVTTVGSIPDTDLMSIMPNGDLIVGGTGVHRLTQAGVESELFSTETFDNVRGSAYDPTNKRLFFVNHSNGVAPDKLEVRPLDN